MKADLIVIIVFVIVMVPAFAYAMKARKRRDEYFRKIAQEEMSKNNQNH